MRDQRRAGLFNLVFRLLFGKLGCQRDIILMGIIVGRQGGRSNGGGFAHRAGFDWLRLWLEVERRFGCDSSAAEAASAGLAEVALAAVLRVRVGLEAGAFSDAVDVDLADVDFAAVDLAAVDLRAVVFGLAGVLALDDASPSLAVVAALASVDAFAAGLRARVGFDAAVFFAAGFLAVVAFLVAGLAEAVSSVVALDLARGASSPVSGLSAMVGIR